LPQGKVVPVLGDGVLAFAQSDHAAAADLIRPVLSEVIRVGSSNAQRELFEESYVLLACAPGASELEESDSRTVRRTPPVDT
jgi:hypothetical protein